jgi:hypothetical protein
MGYLKTVSVIKASLALALAPLPQSLACNALCCLGSLKIPTSKKGLHQTLSLDLGPPSLQNCELNKPLLFINYPVCGIPLQQHKMNQDSLKYPFSSWLLVGGCTVKPWPYSLFLAVFPSPSVTSDSDLQDS